MKSPVLVLIGNIFILVPFAALAAHAKSPWGVVGWIFVGTAATTLRYWNLMRVLKPNVAPEHDNTWKE